MEKLNIGFAVNTAADNSAEEINMEYTSGETVNRITKAFQNAGSAVHLIEAGPGVRDYISKYANGIDLVFNISEGPPNTEGRKYIVPGILDELGIPYTGSGLGAQKLGGDKAATRKVLERNRDFKSLRWQEFLSPDASLSNDLSYPLFVKPTEEGSSMGITQESLVYSDKDLRRALEYAMKNGRRAIVEEFLPGKEFTVGMVGNVVLPSMEVDMEKMPDKPKVRDQGVKKINGDYIETVNAWDMIEYLAKQHIIAHAGVNAKDYSRSDFRMGENELYPTFLEINLLPGLDPKKPSKLARGAEIAYVPYEDMVCSMVYSALKRHLRNPSHSERLSKKDRDGFRAAYGNMLNSKAGVEDFKYRGVTYRILKPFEVVHIPYKDLYMGSQNGKPTNYRPNRYSCRT